MIDFDAGDRQREIPPMRAMNITAIALVFGLLSIICIFIKMDAGSAALGAFGLLFGGYAMGFVRRHGKKNVKILIAISAVALILAAIGFMFGFVGLAHSL